MIWKAATIVALVALSVPAYVCHADVEGDAIKCQTDDVQRVSPCIAKHRKKLESDVLKGGEPFWNAVIADALVAYYRDAGVSEDATTAIVLQKLPAYQDALLLGSNAADWVASRQDADPDDTLRWMREKAKDKAEREYFAAIDPARYKNEIKYLDSDYKLMDKFLNRKPPSAWAAVLLAAAGAASSTLTASQQPATTSPAPSVSAPSCSSDTPECEATGRGRHGRSH